jgi:hypothetical protein
MRRGSNPAIIRDACGGLVGISHNREQQQEEARRNARRDLQTELSRLFSDNKEIHLSCNDWRIEDPLVFSIEIHSLTEMDVRRMAEVLIPQTPGFTLAPR